MTDITTPAAAPRPVTAEEHMRLALERAATAGTEDARRGTALGHAIDHLRTLYPNIPPRLWGPLIRARDDLLGRQLDTMTGKGVGRERLSIEERSIRCTLVAVVDALVEQPIGMSRRAACEAVCDAIAEGGQPGAYKTEKGTRYPVQLTRHLLAKWRNDWLPRQPQPADVDPLIAAAMPETECAYRRKALSDAAWRGLAAGMSREEVVARTITYTVEMVRTYRSVGERDLGAEKS